VQGLLQMRGRVPSMVNSKRRNAMVLLGGLEGPYWGPGGVRRGAGR
jgi:hypothetical protein